MLPQLFKIGPLTVYSFGALMCVAFLFSFWITRRLIRTDRVDPIYPPDAPAPRRAEVLEFVYDLGFGAMISGVVGARVWHIFQPENFRTYWEKPAEIFRVWEGGLVFYGGFIFAFFTCLVLTIRKRIPPWQMGDHLAPGIAFAHAIARLGCFLNGCCYGKPVDWGVVFPNLPWREPRHPTQLYETASSALIGVALLILFRKRSFRGQVFFAYAALYAVARFAVEFVRDDPRGGLGPLSTSQWIAIGLFPMAAIGWIIQKRREPITPNPEPRAPNLP